MNKEEKEVYEKEKKARMNYKEEIRTAEEKIKKAGGKATLLENAISEPVKTMVIVK